LVVGGVTTFPVSGPVSPFDVLAVSVLPSGVLLLPEDVSLPVWVVEPSPPFFAARFRDFSLAG